MLATSLSEPLPNQPIEGVYVVEPAGTISLGYDYGRIRVAGLTLEEADTAILKRIKKLLRNPRIAVTRVSAAPDGKLERRVEQLENEVRELRAIIEELKKRK